MTNESYLRGLTRYPIPKETLEGIAVKRGVDLNGDSLLSVGVKGFDLATADLLWWLSNAPDISQGGENYSFDSDTRKELRKRAKGLYEKNGEEVLDGGTKGTIYGYKGSRL